MSNINFVGYQNQHIQQGFLQLDEIGSQHDPHLRMIGGRRENLKGRGIHMLQNKG